MIGIKLFMKNPLFNYLIITIKVYSHIAQLQYNLLAVTMNYIHRFKSVK